VNKECIEAYKGLKLDHQFRFIVFGMSDDRKEIIVKHRAPITATYDDFLKEIPENDCRYAIYDYEFEIDGGQRSKVVFINWAPDTAHIRSKMLYAASKESFRKNMSGLAIEVQATDSSEVELAAIDEKVMSFAR
jgi:cofilin